MADVYQQNFRRARFVPMGTRKVSAFIWGEDRGHGFGSVFPTIYQNLNPYPVFMGLGVFPSAAVIAGFPDVGS